MHLEPLADYLILKGDEPEKEAAPGILLAEKAKLIQERGRVLSCGPGKVGEDGGRRPLSVREGDHVWFNAHEARVVEFENETFIVVSESEVHAIIE